MAKQELESKCQQQQQTSDKCGDVSRTIGSQLISWEVKYKKLHERIVDMEAIEAKIAETGNALIAENSRLKKVASQHEQIVAARLCEKDDLIKGLETVLHARLAEIKSLVKSLAGSLEQVSRFSLFIFKFIF